MTYDKAGDAGKLKIAVFELGEIPEPLARKYPYYPRMIAEWISPSLPEADFTGMSPVTGDPLPEVDAFDGYIYSGSRHGIYEDLTWIEPLKEFIREATAAGKPQFGICFGHQIAAEALGGKAVKSDQGWGIGVHKYDMQLDFNGTLRQLPVMVMHQDQVIALPDIATVVGSSEFCPIGAVRYDDTVLTVQFHPEFDATVTRAHVGWYAELLVEQGDAPEALQAACIETPRAHALLERFAAITLDA